MIVTEIPPGSVGCDFLSPLSREQIAAFAAYTLPGTRTRFTFVERYLENLTVVELQGYLDEGLIVTFVGESRPNGYIPTATEGAADGAREVARAHALGVPTGPGIGCDLEGMAGTTADTQAYAKAWCSVVQPAGLRAYCYEGAGVPLTPQQLYSLPFTGYWRSLSNVQPIANVDYFMYQGYPTMTLQLSTGPLQVDLDCVFRDKRLRVPVGVAA
jgi:hypothetical protein